MAGLSPNTVDAGWSAVTVEKKMESNAPMVGPGESRNRTLLHEPPILKHFHDQPRGDKVDTGKVDS